MAFHATPLESCISLIHACFQKVSVKNGQKAWQTHPFYPVLGTGPEEAPGPRESRTLFLEGQIKRSNVVMFTNSIDKEKSSIPDGNQDPAQAEALNLNRRPVTYTAPRSLPAQ